MKKPFLICNNLNMTYVCVLKLKSNFTLVVLGLHRSHGTVLTDMCLAGGL